MWKEIYTRAPNVMIQVRWLVGDGWLVNITQNQWRPIIGLGPFPTKGKGLGHGVGDSQVISMWEALDVQVW